MRTRRSIPSARNAATVTAITVVLACGLVEPLPAQGSDPRAVHLATAYQTQSIGGAHRFVLRGEPGGSGTVVPDPNECVVDEFGEPLICTEIFPLPVDVRIRRLDLVDRTGEGRRIFHLDGNLRPEGSIYYLMIPRHREDAHRLIIDVGGEVRHVITLEQVERVRGRRCPKG